MNFANPEASEEGATSLEAGVGGDGDGGDVALLELESAALSLPLALPSAAEGLRMLASGAMTFVVAHKRACRGDKRPRERKRERS